MKQLLKLNPNKITAGNTVFASGRLTCFIDTFVQGLAFVLRINTSSKNPAHL